MPGTEDDLTLEQESATYDRARVDPRTGEILEFDRVLLESVIRRGEIDFISVMLNQGRKSLRVLDLGCGGGWLTRTLVRMGHSAIGVDVSGGILRIASEGTEVKGRLVRADGHILPFRSESFDAVICVGALHHTELRRLLPGLGRIIRRDGILVFLEPNKLNPLSEIGRRLFPLATHTPGERPYSPRELKEKLAESGWETKEYRTLFVYALTLSYLLRNTTGRFSRKLAILVERHEKYMQRWLSFLPIGAVIVGIAKLRPESRLVGGISR